MVLQVLGPWKGYFYQQSDFYKDLSFAVRGFLFSWILWIRCHFTGLGSEKGVSFRNVCSLTLNTPSSEISERINLNKNDLAETRKFHSSSQAFIQVREAYSKIKWAWANRSRVINNNKQINRKTLLYEVQSLAFIRSFVLSLFSLSLQDLNQN